MKEKLTAQSNAALARAREALAWALSTAEVNRALVQLARDVQAQKET